MAESTKLEETEGERDSKEEKRLCSEGPLGIPNPEWPGSALSTSKHRGLPREHSNGQPQALQTQIVNLHPTEKNL